MAIVDLTDKMDAQGRLQWNAPEESWPILRFGYTPTGVRNNPSPAEGRGLECDKLGSEGGRHARRANGETHRGFARPGRRKPHLGLHPPRQLGGRLAKLDGQDAVTQFGRPRERGKFQYDFCPPEVVLTRMAVENGRLVLPDGMSYSVLVLPRVQRMTPALVEKIAKMVEEGATVIGGPPVKTPGLAEFPIADPKLRAIVERVWGTTQAPEEVVLRRYRPGRVLFGGPLFPTSASRIPDLRITGAAGIGRRWLNLDRRGKSRRGRTAGTSLLSPSPRVAGGREARVGLVGHDGRQ